MFDSTDAKVLHALQCSPRASFRKISETIEVSEQTVARRYQALRRSGVVRVVGLANPAVHGQAQWVARIRCRPDRVNPLADALARRPDVAYANLASGGTEIVCTIRSPMDAQHDDVLLQQLPRSASVLDVTVDLVLHTYGVPGSAEWTGYGPRLTPEQVGHLTGDRTRDRSGPPEKPSSEDAPLLAALADDGRTSQTRLAAVTGWTPARVARRLDALEATGALTYEVDLLPEPLGHHLNATLWLQVAPAHLHAVGEELAAHQEVAFAAATSGTHNLMAIVICRDTQDFYRYLTTRAAAAPGIHAYQVSIRVRRLKQALSVVTRGRLTPTPE